MRAEPRSEDGPGPTQMSVGHSDEDKFVYMNLPTDTGHRFIAKFTPEEARDVGYSLINHANKVKATN